MFKRAWIVICLGWAAIVIGLQASSDSGNAETWKTVYVIAALPFLFGKLLRLIVFGLRPRPNQFH